MLVKQNYTCNCSNGRLHFICFNGLNLVYREEEAKRQCVEAEQKLRQERQRSVSLEQQLEKAKLDSRKDAMHRSRTGSVWTHMKLA